MGLQTLPNLVDWPEATGGTTCVLSPTGVVDAADEGLAFVFPAPKTGTIKKIGWRTGTVTTGGALLVQLETLTGAAPAVPSGTLAGTNTTAEVTVQNTDDNLWFLTALTAGLAVTKGQMVCAVVRAKAGFTGNLILSKYTYTGTLVPASAPLLSYVLHNLGAGWVIYAGMSPFAICYDDGAGGDEYPQFPGGICPLASLNSNTGFDSGDTPDEVGNATSLPFRARVWGLWFWGDLDADTTLQIRNSGTGAILDTIAADSDNRSGTGMGTHYYPFADGGVVLEADTFYDVTILPGASPITVNDVTLPAAAMLGHLPGGTTCYWVQYTDAGSRATNTARRCLSIGLLIDQIDTGAGGTYPAAAKVWHDAGDYGSDASTTPEMVAADIPTNSGTLEAADIADGVIVDPGADQIEGTHEGGGGYTYGSNSADKVTDDAEAPGTLHMADYTLISGVVAAADVRYGVARYSGGSNGSLVGVVDSTGTLHAYGTCSSAQAWAAAGIVHDSGTVASSGTLTSAGAYNATGWLVNATTYVASPDFPDVGNVRPPDTTNGVEGTLANLVATDAAYVALEEARNNDNGTVAGDITTGNSVKIRNTTINGSLDMSLYALIAGITWPELDEVDGGVQFGPVTGTEYEGTGVNATTLLSALGLNEGNLDTQLAAAAADSSGVTELLTRIPDATAGETGGLAIVGSEMDLVDSPNTTAVDALAEAIVNGAVI